MAAAQVASSPAVIEANLNYFLELSEGGTDIIHPGTATDKLRPLKSVLTPITDLRTCTDEEFTLDTCGFQFVEHRSVETRFDDPGRIKSVVYEETGELIKRV